MWRKGNHAMTSLIFLSVAVALSPLQGESLRKEYWQAIRTHDIKAIKVAGPMAARWVNADGMGYFHSMARYRDQDIPTGDYKKLVEVIKLLKSLGANINQPGSILHNTPLHSAAVTYDTYLVTKALIECGANPNLFDKKPHPDTPLSLALFEAYEAPARAMVEGGADLTLRVGRQKSSVLAMAAWNGMANLVELMLKKGARIEQANNEQETALHAACMRNTTENAKVVRILLRRGANRNATSKGTETPLELAKRKKFSLIIKAFG